MNDLKGLDWSSKQPNPQRPSNYSAFSSLKPTPPGSGRASPLPPTSSPSLPSKPATPANDSFSNLVSFSANGPNKNLSLQDQQKRLADLKLQQSGIAGKAKQDTYVGIDDSVWDSLGSGRSTPAPVSNGIPKPPASKRDDEDDDLFAAFNKPQPPTTSATTRVSAVNKPVPAQQVDDDDDPFGLSEFQAKASSVKAKQTQRHVQEEISVDDDDVLGLLGRPISDFTAKKIVATEPQSQQEPQPEPNYTHPQDKAVAELVDMGFPADKARRALETTDSGMDVQAAVGWLLNQAHAEAQEKSKQRSVNRSEQEPRSARSRMPDESVMPPRRDKASTPSNDPTQIAGELGTNLLKTAGSLWKQGQKRFQQAVQEFNSDSESSSQPKWMRDSSPAARASPKVQRQEDEFDAPRRQRSEPQARKPDDSVTDEALMLEAQRPEKPTRPSQRLRPEPPFDASRDSSRDHSPAMPSRLRESSSPQSSAPRPRQQTPPSRAMLNKQAAEEQASQAYVSSARRRKPAAPPVTDAELLDQPSKVAPPSRPVSKSPVPTPPQSVRPVKSTPIQVRPSVPARSIPPVSATSLKASHADREAGNTHFKRGDYSSAHISYTKSLSHLPASHPITVILLTNRALTAIKIGEPKVAIQDAETAITLIGPSKGESEIVDLTNGDSPKPMRDYYGKALMRKAEALEHMEKWAEAAMVWREAVESGHGGATAIQSRQRAENAAKPKPVAVAAQKAAAPARPTGKSAAVLRAGAQAERAAVNKLRAQNAAAEKVDDEKFLLADTVDAKINAWRGGKQDNLRALLGSLDTVLWPEAGWKKISMADLVLPNKVKIQYMKGIAKVHPDKIPTTATTEQRMIAGAVFSTLNEAWDKFKRENGL